MLTTDEKRKLLKRYGGAQPGPLVAVLKCVAGMLALIAITVGPWLFLISGDGNTAQEQSAPRSVKAYPNSNSMAESKRVFEERRRRYEARGTGTRPAAPDVVATDEAPRVKDAAGK